ncbi:uncharacterized protein LOC133308088 [Gastrolobium bilobum]|uniref:uncharacterized protein LOC133308088 n=1 Tax=Gastrolobium bilobum TaxID=150636 RepID=UPI002AB08A65|nr:uncharacterized protein LOC133308088 [Gastrolobium bilobum]XP_061364662.1 uncharacterized protein LOC133308088 [Gastrolobium bilobum]XP_061364663.1 uncharacterized protein LOC133308088 [Gastrolobium bilobum]XP_061364664.1 uncharacterized protein LOC133308088 [Gastrolobium bilobum]
MAAITAERSYVDLRSQLSTNGFSNMLTSDVKYLVSDNSRAKVWSAGYFSFALCILAAVGQKMASTPGVSATLFNTLAKGMLGNKRKRRCYMALEQSLDSGKSIAFSDGLVING